jgi:hypothetical protein
VAEEEEIGNGGDGEKELVNSKIPHYSLYIPSQRRDHGLRRGAKSGNGKPTNGQKIAKITMLPTQRFALIQSDILIDVIKRVI